MVAAIGRPQVTFVRHRCEYACSCGQRKYFFLGFKLEMRLELCGAESVALNGAHSVSFVRWLVSPVVVRRGSAIAETIDHINMCTQ